MENKNITIECKGKVSEASFSITVNIQDKSTIKTVSEAIIIGMNEVLEQFDEQKSDREKLDYLRDILLGATYPKLYETKTKKELIEVFLSYIFKEISEEVINQVTQIDQQFQAINES